jgi:hypothetical protein
MQRVLSVVQFRHAADSFLEYTQVLSLVQFSHTACCFCETVISCSSFFLGMYSIFIIQEVLFVEQFYHAGSFWGTALVVHLCHAAGFFCGAVLLCSRFSPWYTVVLHIM